MKYLCVTIQMKAIEQYFHVVLFIMLYKVILTFKSVNKNSRVWHFMVLFIMQMVVQAGYNIYISRV